MLVSGVVRSMTAESAERAALGAGAIVMDVLASNDRRLPHEKIERISLSLIPFLAVEMLILILVACRTAPAPAAAPARPLDPAPEP